MNHKPLLLLFFLSFIALQASSQSYDSLRNAIAKLLPPAGKYDESWLDNDSMRSVKKNDKYGLLNNSFKEIVPCIYDNIIVDDRNGFITLVKDGKYGLANSAGKIILECIYNEMQLCDTNMCFPDDAIHAKLNGKRGRVSYTGAIITPFLYDNLQLIDNHLIIVSNDNKYGVIDYNNNVIIPNIYDDVLLCNNRRYFVVYKKEDGYGIVNSAGTMVLPCRYNIINQWIFTDGLFTVQLGSNFGLIDSINNIFIPFAYDNIIMLGAYNGIAYCMAVKNNLCGLVDQSNKLIVDCNYNDVKLLKNGIVAIKDTGSNKWGCINLSGKLLIPCEYDYVYDVGNGWKCVEQNKKWGCIDTNNNIIIPITYSNSFNFENGFITTKTAYDTKLFFDNTGRKIIPEQIAGKYKDIGCFVNGVAVVTDANEYKGLINKKGELLQSCECETITNLKEGVAWCVKDGKYVLIDRTGRKKIEVSLNFATDFYEGLSLVQNNSGYGFIDTSGKFKVPCIYEDGNVFTNGYACMKKDGKWGMIDKTGKVILDFKYDEQFYYSEGLLGVKENNKCFYLDIFGKKKIVLKENIIDLDRFSNGLAMVSDSNKCGFIDKTGKLVIPLCYQRVTNFVKGRAVYMVSNDSKERSVYKFGLLDKSGKKITNAVYDRIWICGIAAIKVVLHTFGDGLIGDNGEILAPCIYEDISLSNNSSGICSAKLNGKWGYLNKQGKTIIPHKFDSGGEFSEGVAVVKYTGKWLIINTKGNTLAQIGEAD